MKKIWCRDCKEFHIIDSNVPLNLQLPNHAWGHGDTLRLKNLNDIYVELAERDICPICGVSHGHNPYTGCNV